MTIMGVLLANYRQWLCVCPQAPKLGNESLPEPAGVHGTACWVPVLHSVAPNGPKPRPTPKSLDEMPTGSAFLNGRSRGYFPGPGCRLGDGVQSGQGSSGGYAGRVPHRASRIEPASAAQKWPIQAVQGGKEDSAPGLSPSPIRSQATRSHP